MRRRKVLKITAIVLGICAIVTLIGNFHWFIPPSSENVRVELTGTPGQKVTGTYTADGVTHPFSGTVPAAFEVRARRVQYTVAKTDQPGELSGVVYVNGAEAGSALTQEPSGYVRGSVEGGKVVFQTAGDGPPPAGF